MQDSPHDAGAIDRSVGERLRARREVMGLDQASLAERLGCDPALIRDYEEGRARIGAATLLQLMRICGVEIGYFLAGLQADAGSAAKPPEGR